MKRAFVAVHCGEFNRRRIELGWSIYELAKRSGYSYNTVLNLLHGKNVHVDTFLVIADTLGYTIEVTRAA